MSVTSALVVGRRTRRLGALAARVQDIGHPEAEPLSVFLGRGVVRRSDAADNHNSLGADLGKYQLVEPGDLVFNRLRTWQGGFGASPFRGIVSPAYIVLRPRGADARYLQYVLWSQPYLAELTRLSKWMPPSQFDILWTDLRTVEIPDLPLEEQRRIADFLDERVARIDQIIAARHAQILAIQAAAARAAYEVVTGSAIADRRPSGLPWVETLPSHWPVLTVGSQFRVDLGKMLNESRQTGDDSVLYLRNTNVQWDRVTTDDLKSMDIAADELKRYTVEAGDLLICEGGQPGRAAIWEGGITPLGFQKALHRARTRGRSHPGWLLECLRVAVALNVFAIENEQTTIGHLTNEQLRATRFPFPDPSVQEAGVDRLERLRAASGRSGQGLERSIELLREYKQSLITAAVIGELDVTTASTRIPGE